MRKGPNKRLSRVLYGMLAVPFTLITTPPGSFEHEAVYSFLKKRHGIITLSSSFYGFDQNPARHLADSLSSLPESGPSLLLLENYGNAPAPLMEPFLRSFSLSQSPEHHLVLFSTKRPHYFPDDLLFSPKCLWLSKEDFFYTKEETEEIYREKGLVLTGRRWEHTKGWPKLVTLCVENGGEIPEEGILFIQSEILSELPVKLKEGLLRLSSFEEFTKNEAEVLLQDIHAERLLEEYRLMGLLEEQEGKYRFHPVVRRAGEKMAELYGIKLLPLPIRLGKKTEIPHFLHLGRQCFD